MTIERFVRQFSQEDMGVFKRAFQGNAGEIEQKRFITLVVTELTLFHDIHYEATPQAASFLAGRASIGRDIYRATQLPINKWHPRRWFAPRGAVGLRMMARGEATEEQQRAAWVYLIQTLCKYPSLQYAWTARRSAYLAGRAFVGARLTHFALKGKQQLERTDRI